jgi:hypothetical protein
MSEDETEAYIPNRRDYAAGGVERAARDALDWLGESRYGYPRTWAAIDLRDAETGVNGYDDFEAPPIAGYEWLERQGLVARGHVHPNEDPRNERVEFHLTEAGIAAKKRLEEGFLADDTCEIEIVGCNVTPPRQNNV